MLPQFKAPMMTRIRAMRSTIFTVKPPICEIAPSVCPSGSGLFRKFVSTTKIFSDSAELTLKKPGGLLYNTGRTGTNQRAAGGTAPAASTHKEEQHEQDL